MIDPVDLVLGDRTAAYRVQRASAFQAMTERLLDDDARPGALLRRLDARQHTAFGKILDHRLVEGGRNREVEKVTLAFGRGGIELAQAFPERVVGIGLLKSPCM